MENFKNWQDSQNKLKNLLSNIIKLIKNKGIKKNISYDVEDFNFYYKDKILKVNHNKEVLTIYKHENELISNLNYDLINKIDILINKYNLDQQLTKKEEVKQITKKLKI